MQMWDVAVSISESSFAPEPDWQSAFRWTVLAIAMGELACVVFLTAMWDESGPGLPFIRICVGFAMGVLAMAVPLLYFMNEGREISRYCLDHHCGREEEPD
jgi:hypothetical protein